MNKWDVFKKIVSLCASLAVLFFFSKAAYNSWGALKGLNSGISLSMLYISLIACIAAFIGLGLSYLLLMRKMGVKAPALKIMKARAISEISSYVPGKIMTLLARIKYLKAWVSTPEIVASSVLEVAALILSATLALAIVIIANPGRFGNYAYLLFVAVSLCILLMHPKLMSSLINIGLRILKRNPIDVRLRFKDVLAVNACYALYWLLMGMAMYAILKTIYPSVSGYMAYVMLSYAVAWVIGFLGFIFPGGLGIRESVLAYMLGMFVPLPVAIIAAAMSRAVVMLAQFSLAAIFLRA